MSWCFYDFFFFKQKTAYEMRISDWSSDVCSSDLTPWLLRAGSFEPGSFQGPSVLPCSGHGRCQESRPIGRRCDIQNQAVRPQRRAKPLRPFDEKQAVAKQFVEAQLLCLRRILQPVKIDMRDGNADQWRVIGLEDSEAGAWCFFLPTQDRQQAPRQRRFACPQPAPQGNDVDRLHTSEEHMSEPQSLLRISYAIFCLQQKTQQP